MLSRVANSIYWMSRYVERADNTARLVDVSINLALDLPSAVGFRWDALERGMGGDADPGQGESDGSRQSVIHRLIFDERNPNSVVACLFAARENARTVREKIPRELWEEVNATYLQTRDAVRSPAGAPEAPGEFCTMVKRSSAGFFGIMDGAMTSGGGWHFGALGRYLERADMTLRILSIEGWRLEDPALEAQTPFDLLYWTALLKSCSAFQMYRIQSPRFDPVGIAEFLLLDPSFPRSVRSGLSRADYSLHALSHSPRESFRNAAEKTLGRAYADLRYSEIDEILAGGLRPFVRAQLATVQEIAAAIQATFFSPETSERMASPLAEE